MGQLIITTEEEKERVRQALLSLLRPSPLEMPSDADIEDPDTLTWNFP